MSAIVAILNKSAVAVAADSALTHICNSGKEKVWNSSRKLFQLIPGQPVGVSICGNADFMQVPMELIIGLYGKQNQGKSFGTVREYAQDFMDWLHTCSFLKSKDQENSLLYSYIGHLFPSVLDRVQRNMEASEDTDTEKSKEEFLKEELKELIAQFETETKCVEFRNYSFKKFKKSKDEVFAEFQEKELKKAGFTDDETCELLKELVFHHLLCPEFRWGVEIHFFGYGEKEFFPVDIPAEMLIFVDDRLVYYINDDDTDTGADGATVIPSGQVDVVRTVINGISPSLYAKVKRNVGLTLSRQQEELKEALMKSFGDNPALMEQINQAIESVNDEGIYKQIIDDLTDEVCETRSDNFLDVVESYGAEGLAQTAEDLVSIAELASRTSGDTESVQGPIDVAVITKVDGLVWKKRK